MIKKITDFLKNIFNPKTWLKFTGIRMFSTVFYIGYLPDWNRHWSAAFSVLISIIFIINITDNNFSPDIIAYYMILKFIYIFSISLFTIPLFRYVYKPENLEIITIDAFLAQILVFALSIPAIMHINIGINNMLVSACNSFLYCNKYIFIYSKVFLTLFGPYLVLRLFDILEFWPTAYMFLYFKNTYLRLIAGLIPAIYSIITIYLFCLLFFDLEFVEIIDFYKKTFLMIGKHFYILFFFLIKLFSFKSIYFFLKKIGVIFLLDKYGIINSEHYDIKYNLL